MADKRKLQGEIDRCLKKVSEGVETFDDIWQKVQTAANANQKEKYEADLKKEIKKLQRLRDQIKTWLTSNDIKDKSSLMDNRKTIETRMEKFKIVERETKTKAYSKEGLGLATKVDPAQKEKEEVRQWLTDSIAQLQMQIDAFESEIESLHVGMKRKKLDRDKQDRVDELTGWVERHKYHIQKLEAMMRMLDNCSLSTEDIKSVQDDLVYYIESNQEPDFAEDEFIYDELYLDDLPSGGVNVPGMEEDTSSIASSPTSTGPLSPKTPTTIKSTSQELFEDRRRGKTASISSDQNEVPQSPRRPTVKPLSLNTDSKTLKSNKITTPTSNKANTLSRTNSSGSGTSNHVPVTPTQKASSQGSKSSSQLPLLGSGYAVAAGASHNAASANSNASGTSPVFNMSSVSAALPTVDSTMTTTTIVTLSSNTKTTSGFDTGSDSQHSRPHSGPLSLASQNSPSSSSSPSLSPSLVHSQESLPPGSAPPASQDSNMSVPSGPPSQSAPSPNNSYAVSVNTSPNGSSSNDSQHAGCSYSPVVPSNTNTVSAPTSAVSNGSTISTDANTVSAGIIASIPSMTESTVVGVSLVCTSGISQGILSSAVTSVTHPQNTDVLFGGVRSALTALPLAGNPPSVVTSFPLPSTDTTSCSPSSLGNFSMSSATVNITNAMDPFGFSHGVSSTTIANSATSSLSTLKDMATEAVVAHDLLEDKENTDSMLRPMLNPAVAAPGTRLTTSLTTTSAGGSRLDAQMQPLLGVAPLGPVSLSQDRVYQLKMLEAAYKHLPEPSDSERVRPYLQRTPYPTPSYYHLHPPTHMDAYDFFQRLSIETLFFIFYYMEGTKAQYMAAKALKKLSWRFHTKYMTWFQRLEEPKTITDDYEMGTYIYFDYEKWSQRKKDGFTFEYRYLEDRDLP